MQLHGPLVEPVAHGLRSIWSRAWLGRDFDEVDGPLQDARIRIPREAFVVGDEVIVFDRETSRIRAIASAWGIRPASPATSVRRSAQST